MFAEDIFISTVYIAGVLSFFSPCVFPLLPVYLNILSSGGKNSVLKTTLFILGLSMSFILLGFSIGSLTFLFKNLYFRVISALIIIFLGVIQMEIINLSFLQKTKLIPIDSLDSSKPFYSFIFGFTFSLGWTPCIGTTLASVLLLAGTETIPYYSIYMLLVYTLGFATPFIIFSFSYKYLEKRLSFIKRNLNLFKKIGGFLLILMGVLLLTNNLNFYTYFY